MPELEDLLERLRSGVSEREGVAAELVREQQRAASVTRETHELSRRYDDRNRAHRLRREELGRKLAESKQRLEELGQSRNKLDGSLAELRDRLKPVLDPAQALAKLDSSVPILLFPVRLETRFVGEASERELLVRIYPDDCSVDSFEPDLSVFEVKNLQRYWCGVWKAGKNEGLERAAFRELSAAHGAGRALYLTRQYAPLAGSDPVPVRVEPVVILVAPVSAPLPANERAAIERYWKSVYRGHADAAWQALRAELGDDARAEQLRKDVVPFNRLEALPPNVSRTTVPLELRFIVLKPVEEAAVKRQSWTRPPTARLLPERFVLLGQSGEERVHELGELVTQPLAVGPDPLAEGDAQFGRENGELSVPEPLRWMTDFDAAVRAGMGFRVKLTPRQATLGFDRLYVLGVRFGSDPERARLELEELLQHHAHGQSGFALVPQGTPTNNAEQGSSGFSRVQEADELFELARAGERGVPRFDSSATEPLEKRDGLVLAEALGIAPEVLQEIPNADGTDQLEARAMNAALWPATLGYALDTQLRPVFSDATIEQTRRHFIEHVSGRGSIPAIRIGKQPYGILATAARSRMPQGRGFLGGLQAVLDGLEQRFFDGFGDSAPRVGAPSDDPQRQLLDILGLHPSSVEYHLHVLDGADNLWNGFWPIWLRPRLEARMRDEMRKGSELLADFGHAGPDPEIIEKFFAFTAGVTQRPTVDEAPLSETDQLPACTTDGLNYVAWCRDRAERSFDELRRQAGFADGKLPNALLYHLLRHALQLGYYDSAVKLNVEAQRIPVEALDRVYREPSFVHVASVAGTRVRQSAAALELATESRYGLLYEKSAAVTHAQELSVARYIPGWLRDGGRQSVLAEQLAGLRVLEGAPTARLERAFAEHIDLCSYRWDAWALSLVNQRLAELRVPRGRERLRGLYLGAFGWVEGLRPSSRPREAVPLEGEVARVFGANDAKLAPLERDPDNGGHVLAPSLNHAVTAAVLRNGHVANVSPQNPNAFAVDLSSARVRVALAFLEGIRNGQSLGALLGYHLERRLHDRHADAEVDALIYELRRAFPLTAKRQTETVDEAAEDAAIETIEARNVCDGLLLLEHVRESTESNYPWGKALERGEAAQEAVVNEEVGGLFEIYDAIADLCLAESVHQTLMGNPERATAALDAVSKGGFPPEPEVVRTPRSGVTLTHRVALHLDATAAAPAGSTPRALAEPALNAWLRDVLPPLSEVVVRVRYRNTPAASGEGTTEVSLQALGLSPIDALLLVDPAAEQAMNELDDRLVAFVLAAQGLCPDASVELRYLDQVEGKKTVFETAPLFGSLRSLVLEARALKPSDAALQEEAAAAGDENGAISLPALQAARVTLNQLVLDVAALEARLAAITGESTAFETVVGRIDAIVTDFIALQRRAGLHGAATSAGLALRGRADFFRLVRERSRDVHTAWGEKLAECNLALAEADDPSLDDDERLRALVRAERAISTRHTVTLPPLPVFRASIIARRDDEFVVVRAAILGVAESAVTSIAGLWTSYRDTFVPRGRHDPTELDTSREGLALRTLARDLERQLTGLNVELRKQRDRGDELLASAASSSGEARSQALADAGRALLGEGFRILPRFALGPAQADEWRNAYANRPALLAHVETQHDFPVDDWLYGVARVRPKLHDLEKVIQLTSAFARSEPSLTPLQFPYVEGDPWFALELPAGFDPALAGERLLYTGVYANAFDAGAPAHVGLLLDEWSEVLPSKQETAGLAFHYDRPSNEPPQTLLLAVAASAGERWSFEDLELAVVETFELARKRATEPRDLAGTALSRFLPATLMASTAHAISIGSRLFAFDVLFAADEVQNNG